VLEGLAPSPVVSSGPSPSRVVLAALAQPFLYGHALGLLVLLPVMLVCSTKVVWKLGEHTRSTTVRVRQLQARSRYASQEPFIAYGGKECTENATYGIIIVDGAPLAYKLC
jgi:hypothetical protein